MYRLLLIGACASIIIFSGCESADVNGNFWQQKEEGAADQSNKETQQPTDPAKNNDDSSNGDSSETDDLSNPGDQVPFSSLKFTYGDFKGGGARQSGVSISGLRLSSNGLSFKYERDLGAWGLSYTDASAIACFFMQKADGSWVGGKSDWISSSRKTRDLNNVYAGYNGWTLSGIPNPTQAAFVIISRDGKKRSNVISGTWSR